MREQCEGFQAWQWLWRVVGTGEQTGVHSAKQSAEKGAADWKLKAAAVTLSTPSLRLCGTELRSLYSQVASYNFTSLHRFGFVHRA